MQIMRDLYHIVYINTDCKLRFPFYLVNKIYNGLLNDGLLYFCTEFNSLKSQIFLFTLDFLIWGCRGRGVVIYSVI